MSDASTELLIERVGRVVVLTLRRPAFGNRLTQALVDRLTAALETARRDREVAGCVLTGSGEAFCLGGDYDGAGDRTAGRMEFGRAHIELFDAMARLGKPLVAAVNGDAHAGGFAVVAACDLAVIAEGATLGLPEAARGLFPFLALAVVADALPKKLFFNIVYQCRLLTAQEARDLHLVNEIVPREKIVARAVEMVERAASGKPDILMLGRDLYHATRGMTPVQALDQARFALGVALSAKSEK